MLKNLFMSGCLAVSLFINPAYSASQDECAIWICIPGGFPSGCGDAYSAMLKRVRDFKSPLPGFSSCSVDGSSGSMSSRDGRAARMGNGESWLKNTYCRRYGNAESGYRTSPRGCTGTGYYAEVYDSGQQMGETYYFMP